MRVTLTGLGLVIGLFWRSAATADPCEGRLPIQGTRFSGVVRSVGDRDSLCVGPKGRPDLWVEVRLGDFYAPELHSQGGERAKRTLKRLVYGRQLVCRAGRHNYDRVIGYCTLDGRSLGDLLRAAGGTQGGRGWQSRR